MRMCVAATEENSEFANTARHQDPGEFTTVLLRAVREEMECEEEEGRMVAAEGARFSRLFTLEILQHKWCPRHHSRVEQEEHSILQLPIVDIVTREPLITLPQVINAYFRKEEIEDSKCEECGLQVSQRREPDCPPVLLLQYIRFLYDQDNDTAFKLGYPITAPESLTFGGEEYQLRGFLCHRGESCYSGHYNAVVRCAVTGHYYLTNNEDPIELISQEDAMDCALHAYILLYEKQTPDQDGLLDALLGDALQQLRRAGRQVKY